MQAKRAAGQRGRAGQPDSPEETSVGGSLFYRAVRRQANAGRSSEYYGVTARSATVDGSVSWRATMECGGAVRLAVGETVILTPAYPCWNT